MLPFPSLIHELLIVQEKGLDVDDDLEMPKKLLKISTKVYIGAYVQDVGNEELENDFDSLIANNVATGSFAAHLKIMTIMASELVQIRKRRTKITKLLKQLKSENKQLAAREAFIKNFVDNYEEPIPSFSFDDDSS